MYPQELKYTKSHEWVELQENHVKIGITSFAITELTDLTYLEFSVEVGQHLNQGDSIAEVESVKTTSEIYSPISGKVTGVNAELPDTLEELMENPYDTGWMIEVEISDPSELESLLSAQEYEKQASSD